MRFEHRFIVRAPLARVRAFHEAPDALALLTPVPLRFKGALPELREGARFTFYVWAPLPVRWQARYDEVSESGFVDIMEEGPFASWRHEHRFHAIDAERTQVSDTITAEPRALASRVMWASLRATFAYRAWRTRRETERVG